MAAIASSKPTKTWFPVGRGEHERSLVDQMRGLRPVVDEFRMCRSKGRPLTALDVGCAEGLIAMEMAKAGAIHVHGVEVVAQRVADANRLRGSLPCSFDVGNVSTYSPARPYDVLLALAILHKLQDPSATLYRLVHNFCQRLVVIKLPPGRGPLVLDPRSNNVPHDLDAVLMDLGFVLEQQTEGVRDEWIGFWRAKV
jgi:hypothetical protein